MITATNPFTGEVFELEDKTPTDLENAYNFCKQFEKTIKQMQDQLKAVVKKWTPDGILETPNGMFRYSSVQRQTYDKGVIRNLVDEDLFDTFTVIKKSAVDSWLKERVMKQDIDPELNTQIRSALIPDGKPYEVVKYEARN